jgi:hypothetical protein
MYYYVFCNYVLFIFAYISNTCITMFFCNYVLFIFAPISNYVLFSFFIAGDWTKMAGDRHRSMNSIYQRPRRLQEEAKGVAEGLDRQRRRTASRRRGPSPPTPHEEEVAPVDESDEELVPLPLTPLRVSTCKVPRASHRFCFLTNAQWFAPKGKSK